MGPVEGMVVMEELGRGIVLEPLAQSLIAGGVLAAMPTPRRARPPGCQDRQRRSPGGAGHQERARPATARPCAKQKPRKRPAGYVLNGYKKHGARG
jgi:hypothetical protein